MSMFRRKADVIISQAHVAVCDAEIMIEQARTDEAYQIALDALACAQRFMRRAITARDDWDEHEHDEYENYPDVPETDQLTLI